jgi:hypothetical protein
VKPAVGFTLPSAGVTPAPSDKKEKMRDCVPVRIFLGKKPRTLSIIWFPFPLGKRLLPTIRFPFPLWEGEGVRFFSPLCGSAWVYRRHAQAFGGPSDVEANDVAFANQIDPRHRAADSRACDGHERKLERDLLAAMRSHYATSARAVELENHPLVEVPWKTLAVVFVLVRHNP